MAASNKVKEGSFFLGERSFYHRRFFFFFHGKIFFLERRNSLLDAANSYFIGRSQ